MSADPWNDSDFQAVDNGDESVHTAISRIRKTLLQDAEFLSNVKERKTRVARRDAAVTILTFSTGTMLQSLVWTTFPFSPLLFFPGLLLQLVGLAGCLSLAHEAWHGRAWPTPAFNNLLSRFFIYPVLLTTSPRITVNKHLGHHRFVGSPRDPDSHVWAQTEREFLRSLLYRFLVLPEIIRRLSTALSFPRNPCHSSEKSAADHLARFNCIVVHLIWIRIVSMGHVFGIVTGYILPLGIASVFQHIREYRRHADPKGGVAVYDTLCPEWQRLLIAGGYFNLHALHHVFPELPQRELPKTYRDIMTNTMWKSIYLSSNKIRTRYSYFEEAAR